MPEDTEDNEDINELYPNLISIKDPKVINISTEGVYIDTCGIIDLLGNSDYPGINVRESSKIETQEMLKEAASSQIPIFYSEEMLIETMIVLERGQNYQQDPTAMKKAVNELKRIKREIENNSNFVPVNYEKNHPTGFLENIMNNMSEYNLKTGDAKHITICNQKNISNFFTTDGDYMEIPNSNYTIFTTSDNFQTLIDRHQLYEDTSQLSEYDGRATISSNEFDVEYE